MKYWIELSHYDLETAKALQKSGRYLYVGFMCHQAIEKTLKAAIADAEVDPPKSHRLRRLAALAGLYDQMDDGQRHFLDLVEPLSVDTRYPSEMSRISSELSADRCRSIILQTQEIHEWIKARL